MTFVIWPDKDLRPVADSLSFGADKIGSDLQRNRKKSVPNWSASVWPDADIWTRSLRKLLRGPLLYSCEIQGAHARIWFLRFSSRPRAGESTAWNPAVFICNCYYLFGFQFRVILPYSSRPLSQVDSVITMLAMRWMEIGVQWLANVHTLSKTTVLGGE